jgi:hypothetical protein
MTDKYLKMVKKDGYALQDVPPRYGRRSYASRR